MNEWPFVSPRLPYCLPLQHLAGLAGRRTPPAGPHGRLPPPPAGDRDWGRRGARPQRGRRNPGPAVRGRRESCNLPASSAACGPGRVSQISAQARREGRSPREVPLSRDWKRPSAPDQGVLGMVPVDCNLCLKACGRAASRAAGRDQGTSGGQKAEVLGSASFQGPEDRQGWRKK